MPGSLPTLPLASTGRAVTRIGFGAMPLSLRGRPDREHAKGVVRRAVELGVTLIDTADVYAIDDDELGHNERLIAEALTEVGVPVEGGSVLVATKGGMTRPEGRWERDGRPERLREACHRSLENLGVERIGLYQLHCPDPAVPFEESVGALARLREEGKIESVGLSNVKAEQIRLAEELVPVVSVQNAYCPWEVGYRRSPVVEHCRTRGMAFLAYGPLGGSGRVRALLGSAQLQALGAELAASPAELTLAWLLRLAPVVVPIPGATRPASVESSVRAAALELDDTSARRIERAFRALPGMQGLLGRIVARLRSLGP